MPAVTNLRHAARVWTMVVVKAAGEWQVLGVNDIGEEIHATPALSGGRIFVRTHGALYCFGK